MKIEAQSEATNCRDGRQFLSFLPRPRGAPRCASNEGALADHVWEIEELVGLLEPDEAKMIANGAIKRGEYRKKMARGNDGADGKY